MSAPFDYAGLRDEADSLLADMGQAILVRRTVNSGTEYDPTQTTTDYATLGVITLLPRWYPAFVANSDILRIDRLGILSAGPLNTLGIVPTPFDLLVEASGKVYRIIDSKPIAPAGVAVAYVLQLRI